MIEAPALIEYSAQLAQAVEQIGGLFQGLDSLRGEILPKNPRNFAILAEGPLDEIRKLQAGIDRSVAGLERVTAA